MCGYYWNVFLLGSKLKKHSLIILHLLNYSKIDKTSQKYYHDNSFPSHCKNLPLFL